MDIYKKELIIALQESLRIGVVSLGLFLVIFILVRKFVKDKVFPKWVFWVYLIIGIAIIGFGSIKDFNILHDLKKETYVTYYGRYEQRVEGYKDSYYATTLLNGEEVKLLCHFTIASNGEHVGYVVYGEKSKIVVYVGEELPTVE